MKESSKNKNEVIMLEFSVTEEGIEFASSILTALSPGPVPRTRQPSPAPARAATATRSLFLPKTLHGVTPIAKTQVLPRIHRQAFSAVSYVGKTVSFTKEAETPGGEPKGVRERLRNESS